MRINGVSNTNFQGNVIVSDNLSRKPQQNVNKAKSNIQNFVKDKHYNLYFKQDYAKNVINIELKKVSYDFDWYQKREITSDTGFSTNVNITSSSSKYADAAKKLINDYENDLQQKKEKQWEKEYNRQEWEELGILFKSFALIPFIMIIGGIIEGSKEISESVKNMLNKAKKLAIKKG